MTEIAPMRHVETKELVLAIALLALTAFFFGLVVGAVLGKFYL